MRHAVAIDFDGTIARTDYPAIIEPIPEAIDFIKECRQQGVAVILWTCRTDRHLDEALAWCDSKGLKFDAVNANLPDWGKAYKECFPDVEWDCRKVCADLYIDDRSLGGIDWHKAFEWLKGVGHEFG